LTVAAFDLSSKAMEKLTAAKAKYVSILELVEKNPTGANIKIIR
jgi:ribosomal protein L18E